MSDLLAGIAVSLVLVPQAMAYAEIAGLPASVGLLAAALPPLLAAPFASSPYLQTGPTAMTSLLTFGALSAVAEPGTVHYIKLAALLALIVGVGRLALGLLRLGWLAYLMSQPVLLGFTSGAAILIIASQLPTALGARAPDGGVLYRASWTLLHPGDWQVSAIAFALFTALAIVGGRRIHRLFPGVLLAVAVGIVVSRSFDYSGDLIGAVESGFPRLGIDFPWGSTGSLLVAGGVIALVGFAEPAALARTFATTERQPWNPDREFIGQGMANLASAVSGGFPVGGSFARSSLNHMAGARTRWSGAITGFTVLIFLPVAGVVETLPRAVLAGIVITAGINLVHITSVLKISKYSRLQGLSAVVTFLATLATSPRVERGILIGIGLSLVIHLWRELSLGCDVEVTGTTMTARIGGVLWFGSSARIEELLSQAVATSPDVDHVILDLGGAGRIDYSATLIFEQFVNDAEAADIEVEFVNIAASARPLLRRRMGGRAGIPEWTTGNGDDTDPISPASP